MKGGRGREGARALERDCLRARNEKCRCMQDNGGRGRLPICFMHAVRFMAFIMPVSQLCRDGVTNES